jgi:hypothetical protein
VSWSYSGNPEASSKDAVRFEIQDTEENAQLLLDAEIEYAIVREAGSEPTEQGLLSAAARCCEVICRKFTRQPDNIEGSLQQTYSKMAKNYREMAEELRLRAQGAGEPFAGGQSWSGKRALRQDTDRVQPVFRRGQNESRQPGGRPILSGGRPGEGGEEAPFPSGEG